MKKAKGIYLIADGLGDRPIKELKNLTPLEYSNTPTMDFLCKEGVTGLIHPYSPGYRVGTDWGHICLFGYNPADYYTNRSIQCRFGNEKRRHCISWKLRNC